MLKNKTDEEQSQTDSIKIFDNFFKYLFGLAFFFLLTQPLRNSIDYSTLDQRLFGAILLLFTISHILILLSIFIYTSPFVYQLLRHKSLTKNDFNTIANEQVKPTKTSYQIRRILIWSFIIGTILTLIAYITCVIVVVAINL